MLQPVIDFAASIGADPISLITIFGLSMAFALTMHFMVPSGWMTLLTSPLLLASGLLAYSLGLNFGLVESIPVHLGETGDFEFDWELARILLPSVVILAAAGMCAATMLVIMALRGLQRYV